MKLWIPTSAVFLAGLVLFALSFQYPRYTDPEAVRKIENMDPGDIAHHEEAIRRFYTERAKYLTPKNRFFDQGLGLMSLALSWGCLTWLCGIGRFKDLPRLTTPNSNAAVY